MAGEFDLNAGVPPVGDGQPNTHNSLVRRFGAGAALVAAMGTAVGVAVEISESAASASANAGANGDHFKVDCNTDTVTDSFVNYPVDQPGKVFLNRLWAAGQLAAQNGIQSDVNSEYTGSVSLTLTDAELAGPTSIRVALTDSHGSDPQYDVTELFAGCITQPSGSPDSLPVSTEPISTEPVSTEPISTEPVSTEPVSTEPISTEPVSTEPVSTPNTTPATHPVSSPDTEPTKTHASSSSSLLPPKHVSSNPNSGGSDTTGTEQKPTGTALVGNTSDRDKAAPKEAGINVLAVGAGGIAIAFSLTGGTAMVYRARRNRKNSAHAA